MKIFKSIIYRLAFWDLKRAEKKFWHLIENPRRWWGFFSEEKAAKMHDVLKKKQYRVHCLYFELYELGKK